MDELLRAEKEKTQKLKDLAREYESKKFKSDQIETQDGETKSDNLPYRGRSRSQDRKKSKKDKKPKKDKKSKKEKNKKSKIFNLYKI